MNQTKPMTQTSQSAILDFHLEIQKFFRFGLVQDERVTPRRQLRSTDPSTIDGAISPGIEKIATAGIQYLSNILAAIVELKSQPEVDEFGQLRPSEAAFSLATDILVDAAIIAANEGDRQIPLGFVSTDDSGNLRIEWINDTNKTVVILVASYLGEDNYVYHQTAAQRRKADANAEELAKALRDIN